MPEGLDGFCGESLFMIGVAFDTGVVGKALMKKNFAAVFWENRPGYSVDANLLLLMATDALH